MDSLQGQFASGLGVVIFIELHVFEWIKLLKNTFHCAKHGEEKVSWADILQKHTYEYIVFRDSSEMVQVWSFLIKLWLKLTKINQGSLTLV